MAKGKARPKKATPKKKVATKRKGVKRTPPWKEWEDWSEATFWSFVRSGLRNKQSRYPPRYAVLAAAKRPSQSDNKRLKWEFECAECKGFFPQAQVSVDHIVPCGSLKSFQDLPGFAERLFVGVSGLQVLCDECHRMKTAADKLEKSIEQGN